MKIKKLKKRLQKLIKNEYLDGECDIDSIELLLAEEEKYIIIKGACGSPRSKKSFELMYPDGASAEFVAGMLYQHIDNIES